MQPKPMVYVARRPCGCVVATMLDDTDELHDKDQENRQKHISDILRIWIRTSYKVDRISADHVLIQWFAICPHVARQRRLDEDEGQLTVTDQATGEVITVS